MTKNKIDRIKNMIIVLLIVSSIMLGLKTTLFNEFFNSIPFVAKTSEWVGDFLTGSDNNASDDTVTVSAESGRPRYIAVTNNAGAHYGVKYDTVTSKSLFENVGGFFYEALGSATEPTEITEEDWKTALKSLGLYFDYVYPVPISMIAKWLGADISEQWGNTNIRRICIAQSGDAVCLYYQEEASGLFFCAETAVTFSSLTDRFETYQSNGALFAFELSDFLKTDEWYQLILTDVHTHPVIASENPILNEDEIEHIFDTLGIIYNPNSTYPEADGTLVFVENNFTLRLGTNGHITYKLLDTGDITDSDQTAEEAVETARMIVDSTLGQYCGDADLCLSSVTFMDEGAYVITFEYWVAGGKIHLNEDGWAAKIVVKDLNILEMDLVFRKYTITTDTRVMLPEILACSASASEMILNYTDRGHQLIDPEWVKNQ